MRSTVTLEPDVQRLVEEAMQRDKASFKRTINMAIRRGLGEPRRMAVEVSVPAFRLELLPGIDPMRLNAALDDALSEDALHALRQAGK
jgi:hypothetical protein